MPALPPDAQPYKRTPTFTQDTVPKGLLADHNTRAGVWGLIVVEEGRLAYEAAGVERTVEAGDTVVVAPEEAHRVRMLGPVRFHVVFHRRPDGA